MFTYLLFGVLKAYKEYVEKKPRGQAGGKTLAGQALTRPVGALAQPALAGPAGALAQPALAGQALAVQAMPILSTSDANALAAQQQYASWKNIFFGMVGKINTIFKGIFQTIANKAVDNVQHAILGDLPLSEKSIIAQLENSADLIKILSQNPQFQNALEDFAKEVTNVNLEILEMVKPQLDRMMDKALDTLKQITDKSVRGIMNTCMNILEAFIGEIPIAGGIIALIIAIIRGFNTAMLAVAPGVEFNVEVFVTAFYKAIELLTLFNREEGKLKTTVSSLQDSIGNMPAKFAQAGQAVSNLAAAPFNAAKTQFAKAGQAANQAVSQVANTATANINNNLMQGGGGANMSKRIKHITQRIKNTINQFVNISKHKKNHTRKYRARK